ncbi:Fe-S protein assembly co-chaperone HscB [Orbaceae bacterium ESL0721]|nr:Fe-S protein assembly co-chaperone HscB [Orbaceae bacterium ESL0721]
MINYFELFQLPVQLPIDMSALSSKYQALQRQYHPDTFMLNNHSLKESSLNKSSLNNSSLNNSSINGSSINKSALDESEKAVMLQKSATINDGYQTLKNPVKAAQHLLALQGIENEGEQDIIHDEDFLLEQFTLREQLDEIEQDADRLDQFYSEIKERKKAIYQQLLQDLNQQAWQTAKQQLYKIHYLDRLIERIELIQETHEHF